MTLTRRTPLRRKRPMRPSRGTTWPPEVKALIRLRDGGCIGPRVGMPGRCDGPLEIDHVRASGALGRKSPSTVNNGALLCRYAHHPMKTEHGSTWRPRIHEYIAGRPTRKAVDDG
jgi:hypothetical protein